MAQLTIVAENSIGDIAKARRSEQLRRSLGMFLAAALRRISGSGAPDRIAATLQDLLQSFEAFASAGGSAKEFGKLFPTIRTCSEDFDKHRDRMVAMALRMAAAEVDGNMTAHAHAEHAFFEAFSELEACREANSREVERAERQEVRAIARELGVSFAEARKVRSDRIDEMIRATLELI